MLPELKNRIFLMKNNYLKVGSDAFVSPEEQKC